MLSLNGVVKRRIRSGRSSVYVRDNEPLPGKLRRKPEARDKEEGKEVRGQGWGTILQEEAERKGKGEKVQICKFIHACIYRLSSDTIHVKLVLLLVLLCIEMVDWSVYIIILSTYLVYQGENIQKEDERRWILHSCHVDPTAGHMGRERTLDLVDVNRFIIIVTMHSVYIGSMIRSSLTISTFTWFSTNLNLPKSVITRPV